MLVRRLLVVIAASLLGASLFSPVASAAPARGPVLAVSPTMPIPGEALALRGRAAGSVVRAVQLQQQRGNRWVVVATTRSSATGDFGFRMAFKTATALRAVTPKARVRGRKLAAATGPVLTVRPTAQSANLLLAPTLGVGEQVLARGVFSPVRPGRGARLQLQTAAGWVDAASATQDSRGQVSFPITGRTVGQVSYRLMAIAAAGAPAAFSAPKVVQVRPTPPDPDSPATELTPAQVGMIRSVDLGSGEIVLGSRPPGTFEAGRLLVVPPMPGARSGALRQIQEVIPSGGGLVLRTTAADLTEITPSGAPQQVAFTPSGPIEFTPAPGVGAHRTPAARALAAAPALAGAGDGLDLSVKREVTWAPASGVTAKVKVDGTLKVAPTVTMDLELTSGGALQSYRLAGGLAWDVGLSAEASVAGEWSGESTRDLKLGKLRRPFVGMLGSLPVYAELSGELVLEYTITGEVKVKFEQTYQGTSLAGLRNTSETNLSPEPFTETAEGLGLIAEASAEGKAEGFVGAGMELMLYSAAGPYLEVGVAAEASLRYQDRQLTCHFEVGPAGEVGLRTSDALNLLTGRKWDPLTYEVPFSAWYTSDTCPLPPDTQLVTGLTDGTPYGGAGNATSSDGRYVAFTTHRDPRTGAQTDHRQIHLFDTVTRKNTRVGKPGAAPSGYDQFGSMSQDGRFISYHHYGSDATATSLLWDRDSAAAPTSLPGDSGVLSPNGRYYAYRTDRPFGTGSHNTVSVLDLQTKATTLVSDRGIDGREVNDWAFVTAVSSDGRYVLFSSGATNIHPGAVSFPPTTYVWDRSTTGLTRLNDWGAKAPGVGFEGGSRTSTDLRYVVFGTDQRLVPEDTDDRRDVYWWDRSTGERKLVSVFEDDPVYYPVDFVLSADGRHLAYTMLYSDLSKDEHDRYDMFAWDSSTGTSTPVKSARSKWDDHTGGSVTPFGVSSGGRFVSYQDSTLLLPGVVAATRDNVLVWDRDKPHS